MASENIYRMPNPNIPESEKDEEYHKNYVQAICNRSVNANYDVDYTLMSENYKYYHGLQSQEEWDWIQKDETGSALPAQWINYNSVKNRVDNLIGDLINRGYEIHAEAINKDAILEKQEQKADMRTDMNMAPDLRSLEEEFNMPLLGDKFVPESEAELDEYWYKKKSDAEVVITGAMNIVAKQTNWDYERLALFRDIVITGRCFGKNEIVNGMPEVRRIDPRNMIFDSNATDDLLTDASYWGEIRYMNMGEAAEMYNLDRKELEDAYGDYKDWLDGGRERTSSGPLDISLLDKGLNASIFTHENGELRVLVATAYWTDFDYLYRVSDKSTSKNTKHKTIQVWRKGTLIGGKVFKEWGLAENQVRDVDNMSTTTPPYFGCIPSYINNQNVSIVQQIKGLQDLKNISLYNLQLDIARAGAKGIIYDVAQLPEGWDIHTALKYIKTAGIGFIDSQKDDFPSNFNQFSQFDLTLSSSVEQYIRISAMIDDQIDRITGVNDERQGITKNASQAVGVTQSALVQSSLTTEIYFKLFSQFINRIFNHLAGLVKITWPYDKKRFAPLIGSTGVNFLEEDIKLDLQDYNVYVKELPPAIDNEQNYRAIIMAALQSGAISMTDALRLLLETNVREGLAGLEKAIAEQEEKVREAEERKHQQAMEQLQAQQQAQGQHAEKEHQNQLDAIDRQGQWQMKQAGLKSSTDLSKEKIDFTKDLTLEKLKERAAKRVEKAAGKPKV
jgi:hypothetical protein